MAELIKSARAIYELGRAMTDFDQVLDVVTRRVHQIINETDMRVARSICDAADGLNGWELNQDSENYEERRRMLATALEQLMAAAQRYKDVRDQFLSVATSSGADDECTAARWSLERLAEALEAYYGVRLLGDQNN